MQRSDAFRRAPVVDTVMAQGEFDLGGGINFEKKEFTDFDADQEEAAAKDMTATIENDTPPYMPKLSETERDNISKWLVGKQREVKALRADNLYRFVLLVAGNLSVPAERLLRYQVELRHSDERFFGVAGDDSTKDMEKIKSTLTAAISDKTVEVRKQRKFDLLKYQVDMIRSQFSSNIRDKTGIPRTDVRAMTLTEIIQDLESVGENSLQELAEYLNLMKGTVPSEYISVVGGRNSVSDFKNLKSQQMNSYFLSYLFEGYVAEFDTMQRSEKLIRKRMELDSLQELYAETDINTVRKRIASALAWLERPEVLNTADMSEELVMGLDKATTLVQMNIKAFEDVPYDDAQLLFAGGTNRNFTTLFADLVARQINIAHFFEGVRGSFDRNHARIRLVIERILNAMRKFSYQDGTISLGTRQQEFKLDRLDFY
jgi:hypothetical protein